MDGVEVGKRVRVDREKGRLSDYVVQSVTSTTVHPIPTVSDVY